MTALDAIFHFNANARIGHGHAIRSLAISETFATAGWTTGCIVGPSTADVSILPPDAIVADTGSIAQSVKRAMPEGCEFLFLDDYSLAAAEMAEFRPWARQVVLLEDRPSRRVDCDYLIDPTPERAIAAYAGLAPSRARMMVGPEFAALRTPFLEARSEVLARRIAGGPVRRILVAVGGADATDATSLFLDALDDAKLGCSVDVVLGQGAPHLSGVARRAAALGFEMHVGIGASAMASLMSAADIALGAPSSSTWERCCLALPSLLVTTADNQRDIEAALTRCAAAELMGPQATCDTAAVVRGVRALAAAAARRIAMSQAAAALCDGRGSWRILCELAGSEQAKTGERIALRPATEADSETIFAWNCEPEARRYFRNPTAPTRGEHDAWFAGATRLDARRLFVASSDGRPVGTLRFDRDPRPGHVSEISILVSKARTASGIGTAMLRLGQRVVRSRPLKAHIHEDNIASQRAFSAAGFRRMQPGSNDWELAA